MSILHLAALPLATAQEDEHVCTVYFTAIGCGNCKVTDPIVLNEWTEKYDNLVVIEYMFTNWGEENARLLGEYAQKYGSWASVPQLFITSDKVALGRIDVPNAENDIEPMENNPCLLLDSSVPFNELNLNELPKEPKLWSGDRLLIKIGNGEVSSDFLRELLFSQDLTKTIEETTYEIEEIEAEPAPIAYGQINFDDAIKFVKENPGT